MGYETRFKLQVEPSSQRKDILKAFKQKHGYNVFAERCTWWEVDEYTKEISLQHPGVLISISGLGEDTLDAWRKDYLNGALISQWECPQEIPYIPEETLALAKAAWSEAMEDPRLKRIAELKQAIADAEQELAGLEE